LKSLIRKSSTEKITEKYLFDRVKKAGGQCVKMTSPGWPDRLVILPQNSMFFAEVKDTKITLRPTQKIVFPEIEKLGVKLYIITTKEQVDQCILNHTITKTQR
jgi:hypothetical protein